MASVDLGDFLEHLADAVNLARDHCAKANIENLKEYLEQKDGEDFFRFRSVPVQIGGELIHVPLYGLSPQGHLDLDHLKIEFDTVINIDTSQPAVIEAEHGNPKFSLTLSRGLLSRGTEMKVKASFNLKEPCETAEQIRDKLNKLITINNSTKEM